MRFAKFAGVRLLHAIPSVLALSVLTFFLLRLAPGDPARVVAGARAGEAVIARTRADLGLDQPLVVQYLRYLGQAFGGDFGSTLRGTGDVLPTIADAAIVTGSLVLLSTLLIVVVATVLALLAAHWRDTVVDRVIRTLAVGGIAVPSFWVAILVLNFVALPTGWFPIGGWGATPATQLLSLVLPSIAMATGLAPVLLRAVRNAALDVLESDYVGAARAARVPRVRLWGSYVLRNSAVPAVPVLAITIGTLIGGSSVVESVFNLPGLGQLLVQAAIQRDANLLQAVTLCLGTAVVVVYFLADVLLATLDPRVRF